MNNQPETDEKAFFQKHFEAFDSQPDEKVWAAIQQKMEPPTRITVFWRNPRFLSIVAAALLLTSYLTWQWLGQTGLGSENHSQQYSSNPASVPHAGTSHTEAALSPVPSTTSSLAMAPNQISDPATSETSVRLSRPVVVTSGQGLQSEKVASVSPSVSVTDYPETLQNRKRVSVPQKEDNLSIHAPDEVFFADSQHVRTHLQTENMPDHALTNTPFERIPDEKAEKLRKEYPLLQIRGIQTRHVVPKARTLTFTHTPSGKKSPEIAPVTRKSMLSGSWRIFGSATHFMNYYAVSPLHSDAVFVQSIENTPALSSQRSSWQLQAGLSYAFAPRWSIRGAIFYNYQKQVVSYRIQRTSSEITNIENRSPNDVVITRSEDSFSKEQWSRLQTQVGLQLAVLYELPANPSFSHYLVSGMQGGWTQRNEYTSTLQTDVHIGYGLRRPFSPKLAFWLEPSFRYSLQSVQNPVIRIRPYYFGISAGMSFQLSR